MRPSRSSGTGVSGIISRKNGYKVDVAATANQLECALPRRHARRGTGVHRDHRTVADGDRAERSRRRRRRHAAPQDEVGSHAGRPTSRSPRRHRLRRRNIWIPALTIDGYGRRRRARWFDFLEGGRSRRPAARATARVARSSTARTELTGCAGRRHVLVLDDALQRRPRAPGSRWASGATSRTAASRANGQARPPSRLRRPRQTRGAVIGSSLNRTPVAAAMALATAAAAPQTGPSPTPFAPYGPSGAGTSTMIVSMTGMSGAQRQRVVQERAGQQLAARRRDHRLEQRPADTLFAPPCSWPSTSAGLIARPTSCAMT